MIPGEATVLDEFKPRLQEVTGKHGDWRDESTKDFDFYPGRQWDEEDRAEIEGQKRAALVINRVRVFIDSVTGTEITNRFVPKYFPRNPTSEEPDMAGSELLSAVYRYLRDQADVEDEESLAFRDAAICGVGVTDTYQDYLDHPDGLTVTERVYPLHVGWDPTAEKSGYRDRQYEFRGQWYTIERMKSMWPEKEDAIIGFATSQRSSMYDSASKKSPIDTRSYWRYEGGQNRAWDPQSKSVLVWRYTWWSEERWNRIYAPGRDAFWVPEGDDGEPLDPEEAMAPLRQELAAAQEQWQAAGGPATGMPPPPPPSAVESVNQPRKVFYEAFIAGDRLVLEVRKAPVQEFSLRFITVYEDRDHDGSVTHFGLMRPARDPQRWINKFWSQAIHYYSVNAKGLLVWEENAFNNESKVPSEWAKPDGSLRVKEGKLAQGKEPYRVVNTASMPSGAESLLQFASGVLPQVFGINEQYFTGFAEDLRRTSTSTVQSVQRQVMVTLAPLFNALRLYRKQQARLILDYVREFMPDGQVLRIAGKRGAEYVVFTRDAAMQEYDIVVDEAPASKTERMEIIIKAIEHGTFDKMLSLGLVTPELIEFMLDEMPAEVIESVKQRAIMAEKAQARAAAAGAPPTQETVQ
jgi:hypothetical protein